MFWYYKLPGSWGKHSPEGGHRIRLGWTNYSQAMVQGHPSIVDLIFDINFGSHTAHRL